MYKEKTKYLIVTAISKDENICKWFYSNFPQTITAVNTGKDDFYRLSFKVDKMESWQQTRKHIQKVKTSYNDLMVTITPITETTCNLF